MRIESRIPSIKNMKDWRRFAGPKKKSHWKKSRRVERVEGRLQGLFDLGAEALEEAEELRYQLLTANAGTLAYAQEEGADLAVLIVQVFETKETERKKLNRNDADYRAFVDRLRNLNPDAGNCGGLEGPFNIPGAGRYDRPVELLFGKVVTIC